jgi:hypothetical protein
MEVTSMLFPIEGIDKITLLLQPYIYPYIHGAMHLKKHNKIILYNSGSLVLYKEHTSGNIYLTIQCSFILLVMDMQLIIANAIIELVDNGIIQFAVGFMPFLRNLFITQYLCNFVWLVHDVEFYFSFREECVEVVEYETDPAIPDEYDYEEKALIHIGSTIYSRDFNKGKRTSSLILYNKQEELAKKQQTSDAELAAMTHPLRIEFKLYKNNTRYLSLANFQGTYEDIIHRFTPHLASLYARFFKGYIYVNSTETPHFNRIYAEARKSRVRCRGELRAYDASEQEKITKRDNEAVWTLFTMLCKRVSEGQDNEGSDGDDE